MTLLRLSLPALVLLSAACEPRVRVYETAKEAPVLQAPAKPSAAASSAESGELRWKLPSGWTEKPGGGMRFATLVMPSGLELAVSVFPGAAGGLLPNVNRWRGQIALEAIDQAQFEKDSERLQTPAGSVIVVDYTGAKLNGRLGDTSRLLAAILEKPDRTWFFKLNGDVEPVGAAKPAVVGFLKTLH